MVQTAVSEQCQVDDLTGVQTAISEQCQVDDLIQTAVSEQCQVDDLSRLLSAGSVRLMTLAVSG